MFPEKINILPFLLSFLTPFNPPPQKKGEDSFSEEKDKRY
jgi:hypothetical protein